MEDAAAAVETITEDVAAFLSCLFFYAVAETTGEITDVAAETVESGLSYFFSSAAETATTSLDAAVSIKIFNNMLVSNT